MTPGLRKPCKARLVSQDIRRNSEPLRFGYIHLGKRKAQRLLAPHYVAAIRIEGEERQAYQFIVAATQKTFQPLCLAGHKPPPPETRRAA